MPVEVRYQGRAETVALVEGKLHIGTVANIFGLDPMSIKIKGATEPVNPSDGLTFNKFEEGGVLEVTGQPREGECHNAGRVYVITCLHALGQ